MNHIFIGYTPPKVAPAVTGRAGGPRRGIPPQLVILSGAEIVAKAQHGNGGRIEINADAVLKSSGSMINAATANKQAIQGIVFETNPSQDLSGQLAVLPNALLSVETTLQDVCSQRMSGNFSSFILSGQGGLAMEPGGWLPSVMGWDALLSLSLDPQPATGDVPVAPSATDGELGCCGGVQPRGFGPH